MSVVAVKRETVPSCRWQIQRLLDFVDYEIAECEFYELCAEKLSQKIPLLILEVILFFQKEQYRKKPGSLVSLYRTSREEGSPYIDFVIRYERYYKVLQEKGFV